jgi:hypothetical protein
MFVPGTEAVKIVSPQQAAVLTGSSDTNYVG